MSIVKAKKAKKEAVTQGMGDCKKESSSNTFEGKVVSMVGDKLVMRNKIGKTYSHTLAKDAKITCDGTSCKAGDLKVGSEIRVTTKKDDRNVATCIESLGKNIEFATCCN